MRPKRQLTDERAERILDRASRHLLTLVIFAVLGDVIFRATRLGQSFESLVDLTAIALVPLFVLGFLAISRLCFSWRGYLRMLPYVVAGVAAANLLLHYLGQHPFRVSDLLAQLLGIGVLTLVVYAQNRRPRLGPGSDAP